MFNLFRRKKDTDRLSFRIKMAEKISGKALRYVSERLEDGTENVIGKEGAILRKEDQILVYSSQDVVFRANIAELVASELMSRDGVILQAPDLEHDGRRRTVIAHYTDYLIRN